MIDEAFFDQAIAFKQAGFSTSFIDDDGFVRPKLEPDAVHLSAESQSFAKVVYRGWMLAPKEYWTLYHRVVSYGVDMLTTPEQYLAAHYLPNWYPILSRWTPNTEIFPVEWEEFIPGSETRYFVLNGRYFGQDVAFDLRAMRILDNIKNLIPSPFWSVDIAQRKDGEFRIVEIGDGQVSDIVGWTPERFAEIWK